MLKSGHALQNLSITVYIESCRSVGNTIDLRVFARDLVLRQRPSGANRDRQFFCTQAARNEPRVGVCGRTDAEFYPHEMSDAFLEDDRRVFETGKPIVNRLEVWLDERGNADWSVTTKVPLFGRNGKVIGLMGVSRRDLHPSVSETSSEATRAVDYLRSNIRHIDSIDELAIGIGVSTRTLNRKINQNWGFHRMS